MKDQAATFHDWRPRNLRNQVVPVLLDGPQHALQVRPKVNAHGVAHYLDVAAHVCIRLKARGAIVSAEGVARRSVTGAHRLNCLLDPRRAGSEAWLRLLLRRL